MPVNSPSDYFPKEIVLNILTSCDTFQPIKLHYPHPKNNKGINFTVVSFNILSRHQPVFNANLLLEQWL